MNLLKIFIFTFIYTYNGTGDSTDVARDGVFDGSKYIYACGYTYNTNLDLDWIIVKIDTLGNEIWKKTYDSGYGKDDVSYGISLRSDGKLVVVGYKYNGSDNDWRIAVYDTSNGNLIDSLILGGSGSDFAYSIDAYLDTVFVCGRYTVTGQGWNWRVIKLDPSLNIVWDSVWHGGNGNDISYKVKVLNSRCYVSGYYDAGPPRYKEMKVKIYKKDGTLVREGEWGDNIEKDDDAANSISIDGTGNVYIAGYSSLNTGTKRWKIIKFDSLLQNIKWEKVKEPGSSIRSEEARDIEVKDTFVFICGYVYRNATKFDWRVVRYNLNATDSIIKDIDFNGENDYAHAIEFYGNKVIVFGSSYQSSSTKQDFTITDFTNELTGYYEEFIISVNIENMGKFYLLQIKGKGKFDSIKVFVDEKLFKKISNIPAYVKIYKGREVTVKAYEGRKTIVKGPFNLKKENLVYFVRRGNIIFWNPLQKGIIVNFFEPSGRLIKKVFLPKRSRRSVILKKHGILFIKTDSVSKKIVNF